MKILHTLYLLLTEFIKLTALSTGYAIFIFISSEGEINLLLGSYVVNVCHGVHGVCSLCLDLTLNTCGIIFVFLSG